MCFYLIPYLVQISSGVRKEGIIVQQLKYQQKEFTDLRSLLISLRFEHGRSPRPELRWMKWV
jgi:hypothetical protein